MIILEENPKAVNIYEKMVVHDEVWDILLNDLHCEYPFGKHDVEVS